MRGTHRAAPLPRGGPPKVAASLSATQAPRIDLSGSGDRRRADHGVRFIVGGFCPGTSLVAVGTLKLDGMLFVLGGLFGVFFFGETDHLFDGWWHSSYKGRFTLPDWLDLPTGVAVLLLVTMALGMLYLFHLAGSERIDKNTTSDPRLVLSLLEDTDNTIDFLVSNGESDAAEARKRLKAQGVLNLHMIERGINHSFSLVPWRKTPLSGQSAEVHDWARFPSRSTEKHPAASRGATDRGGHC